MRHEGEIVIRKDEDSDIPCFDIRAKGWYSATVRLSPKPKNQMESHCCHDQTPRCSSIPEDSVFDEVDWIFYIFFDLNEEKNISLQM